MLLSYRGSFTLWSEGNFAFRREVLFVRAKSTQKLVRGTPPNAPNFWANARFGVYFKNSPSAVAVRQQMYLSLLRLPPHERRDKQTCGQFRLSHIVAHCAVRPSADALLMLYHGSVVRGRYHSASQPRPPSLSALRPFTLPHPIWVI